MVLTISVLYVNDESTLLEIGKEYLEKTPEFAVTTAPSASVVLDRLKSDGIQAIVSGYQMPGRDGIDFLKQVRETDKHIPVIMFTGTLQEENAIETFENGADFYLQNGGEPESQFAELSHKIKAAVEHRRAGAQVTTLNRLYTVLSATNKAIVRIHDTVELLNEICRIVVHEGGFTMAWVGLVNGETHLIEPVAASGHVEGYLDTFSISIDDTSNSQGPTGTAFRKRAFSVCNDIESDPMMAPWRREALDRGYRSLAAFPFALGTRNAGVITFFASEPGFFTDKIIQLLDEQAWDISFALVNLSHEKQRIIAENELKKSELKYRRLFETAQDAIVILDGDTGEIIDANKFILDMLGYPLEDFVGRHLWELGFLKDKSFAQTAFEKLRANGYIRYEDLPLETKQGRAISVEFVSNVYLVGDKKIIQCNIRDITERKLAEEERARLAAIVKYSDDAIIGKSLEGYVTTWNAGAERIYGYTAHEMVGKSISLLVPPDLTDDTPLIIERIGNGEPVIRYETWRRKKNGGLINVILTASQIRDAQNRLIGVSTIAHDITRRKLVEEAMQASEARYRRLFETAQDAIVILDGDTGKIIDANKFILDMLGYPLEDFVGRQLWELGFLKDKSFAKNAFAKLQTDGYIRYEDLPLETKQGKAISVEFVSNVYLVGDKKIIQCNIRDITDRKRAEDGLALASRKLNLMSGITRHDIMNQLTVLSGSLELSLGNVNDLEGITHINRAQNAARTIQHQIAFTREYEELGVKAPVWQQSSAVIRSAASQMASKTIAIEIPDERLEIYADPLLVKVFYNLFDNTQKYGGAVTRISISHHPAGNGLILTVADNGSGISPDDKKHLFERGFGKHTGLGLFLSREILSITGISISETGIPGNGARFEILVPEGTFRFSEKTAPS